MKKAFMKRCKPSLSKPRGPPSFELKGAKAQPCTTELDPDDWSFLAKQNRLSSDFSKVTAGYGGHADPLLTGTGQPRAQENLSHRESERATKVARVAVEDDRDKGSASSVSAGFGPALPPPPPPPSPVFPRVLRPGVSSLACPKHGKNHRWTMLNPCLDCIETAEQALL